jgi:adenine-specific DNA-methyltransferase
LQGDEPGFPPTRYLGSKRRILPWIAEIVGGLEFDSALDVFGGTGCVSYLFKSMGKRAVFNDLLRCNLRGGRALIENAGARLTEEDLGSLFARSPHRDYDDFIERTFDGVYFLQHENRWLDTVAQNVLAMGDRHKQALAFHALFQASLSKRPYSLFHRANLYMRTADVARSFGNKTTWDRPFEEHLRDAAALANAAVFDNGRPNEARCGDALETGGEGEAPCELVYIDPPYLGATGAPVDYLDFYHFLEGMALYPTWPALIDAGRRHRPFRRRPSPWVSRSRIAGALDALFARHARSVIVVSYREDGVPSPGELASLLGRHKQTVRVHRLADRRYALSTRTTAELLLVGT